MFKRIIDILIIVLVSGVLLLNSNFSIISAVISGENVLAAPLADGKEYLPLILNNFKDKTVFGVEMYDMTHAGGLDKMKEAGATFLRHNDYRSGPDTNALIWAAVEPNEGERNWSALSELDTQLINASNRGMNVILPVRSTPKWARDQRWPDSPCGPINPDHYEDFSKFMFDAVKRYSQPPYNVKHWEIYNEPDYKIVDTSHPFGEPHGCWGTWDIPSEDDGYGNGIAYGKMLKDVYQEIKKADPEAQVLTGGILLECDPRKTPSDNKSQCERAGHINPERHESYSKFFEGILVAGAGDSFDGVSFHSYDFYPKKEYPNIKFGEYYNYDWDTAWNTSGPVTVAKMEYIKELLDKYSITDKDFYNTESGLLNNLPQYHTVGVCTPFDNAYEKTKASYIVQQYAHAHALELKANIWFHTFGWRCTALLKNDLTPVQPAYDAYKFASNKIGHASFVRTVTNQGDGVKIFEFQSKNNSSKFWLVWSLDGANHNISLPQNPLAIFDMVGNPLPLSGKSFTISLTPHYIEY